MTVGKFPGRCVAAYSGGKDSHLAVQFALEKGLKVESLIYLDGGASHAGFFHDSRKVSLVKLHARLMGLPVAVLKTPPSFEGKKGEETSKLLADLCRRKKVSSVYCGATAEDDNTQGLKKAAARQGFSLETPLLRLDFSGVLRECARRGIKALITGVEKRKGLKGCLGRLMDPAFAGFLAGRPPAAAAVDGNDFQTFVLASPLFRKEIRPAELQVRESRDQYFLEIGTRTLRDSV
ncbi:MAG TPA: hypothetical protein PKI19_10005 [Elusimicrobiales bacterium]|mgnify:CR=1 FL=1|nr:hypothetical protein [Elusimicrobiales bacterium]